MKESIIERDEKKESKHLHLEKEPKTFPRKTSGQMTMVPVYFIAPCIVKEIRPTINKEIVLCVEWTWCSNHLHKNQHSSTLARCTLKSSGMSQGHVQYVEWSLFL